MSKRNNLIGQTFGLLTVTALYGVDKNKQTVWTVSCACGNKTFIRGSNLKSGASQSCGCSRYGVATHVKHGLRYHPLYSAWNSMKGRCNNENDPSYKNYGGRGIKVCQRWNDFALFLKDMGEKPSPEHSIDRINNNGDYEPSNCRWATAIEQRHNRG